MRLKVLCWAIVLFVFAGSPAFAEEEMRRTVGLRAGAGDGRNNESFWQYEAYASYTLPWYWKFTTDWTAGLNIGANAGYLSCEGGAFVGSFGLGLYLTTPHRRAVFSVGLYPTYLGRSSFGKDDLGGSFHFTSVVGLNYNLNKSITIGYRFQHMSNAGTSNRNPGLNMHMVEVGYRF